MADLGCYPKFYIGSRSNKFYSIDVVSGKTDWEYETKAGIFSSPAIQEDKVIFGCDDGNVYCLNLKNGQKLWNHRTEDEISASPSIMQDRVYITTGSKYVKTTSSKQILCLNINDGNEIWKYSCDDENLSSTIVSGGVVFVSGNKDHLYAISATNGQKISVYKGNLYSQAMPVVYDNKLFIQNYDGELLCFGDYSQMIAKKITLEPDKTTLQVGKTIQFKAIVFDVNDAVIPGSVVYEVSDKNLAIIDQTGLMTGKKPGNITLKACYKDLCVTKQIKVVDETCWTTITPNNMDFDKIQRGRSKSISAKITSNRQYIEGKFIVSKQWIEVSPKTFKTNNGIIEFTVTINASLLPEGEVFKEYVEAFFFGADCISKRINIGVKTDKDISLKLIVGNKKAQLNQEAIEMDVPPQIVKGRTLIPIRFVSETFGSKVEWEASTGKITISRLDFVIVLWKDKRDAIVNGKSVTLDVPATIVQGRTLVPLRFISEAFGAKVDWNANEKSISISWQPN